MGLSAEVPEVLRTDLGLPPRAVFKTSGTVSRHTDLPAGKQHTYLLLDSFLDCCRLAACNHCLANKAEYATLCYETKVFLLNYYTIILFYCLISFFIVTVNVLVKLLTSAIRDRCWWKTRILPWPLGDTNFISSRADSYSLTLVRLLVREANSTRR